LNRILKDKILFIINPIAGKSSKKDLENLIFQFLDLSIYEARCVYSMYPGHAEKIAIENANKFDILVAVGGDGTVNEIVQALKFYPVKLAILPIGSGNGLARHLRIPRQLTRAIQIINNQKFRLIDVMDLNGKLFTNIAGIGFDAHIGKKFQESKKRGFITYTKLVLTEFFKFNPIAYNLQVDGILLNEKAFLISFANTSQYGNNAFIAPDATIDDGQLDVIIIKKFPKIIALGFVYKLFSKSISNSKYIQTFKAKNIELKNPDKLLAHIDGEPSEITNDIKISVNNKSLQILCP